MRSLTRALTAVVAISLASGATALTPPTQRLVMRFVPGRIAVAPAAPTLELGASFTMEAWVYLEAYQPWAYLLGKAHDGDGDPYWGYLIALTEDGRHVQFQQSTGTPGQLGGVFSSVELPLHRWTHVAATLGGGVLRLFVDGIEVASGPSPGPPRPNALPFGVGGALDNSGWPNANFTGAMRQVRVWSRALAAEELRARAGDTLVGNETGLLAYWPLDDGSGQSARDLGPNHLALRRGLASAWDGADPGWIHAAVLDAGPFFSLEGPFEIAPGCDNATIPCLGVGTVIDFDSDGASDLLLTRAYFNPTRAFPYAPMVCLHNDGHGGFTDVSVTVCPQARNRTMANFAVADFDGDGRQDLLVADGGPDHAFGPGGQNHLLLQTPDGRLEDATAERLPLRNVFTHTVCTSDFTGDGWSDVFVGVIGGPLGSNLTGGNRLYRNDGHGHFSRGVAGLPPEIARGGAWTSAAVDVDRDGDLDLVMSSGTWPMHDTLLINDGSGSFTLAPENALPERHTAPYGAAMHMTSADLDGDGWPDLLHFEQTPEQALARLCLFLNNHDRTFRDASSQIVLDSSDAPVDNVGYPRIVDLDRDGRPDFAFGTYGGNGPRPMFNAGGGVFVDGSEFWPLLRPNGQVLPADFDGDGDVDVVINNAIGSSIWLLRQVKAPDLRLLKGDVRPPRRHVGGG